MAFSNDTAASWQSSPVARPARHPILGTLFMLAGGLGLAVIILGSEVARQSSYVQTVGETHYWTSLAIQTLTKFALLVAGMMLIARRRGAVGVVLTALVLSAADSAVQCFAPLPPKPLQMPQSTYDAAIGLARLLGFLPAMIYGLVAAYLMLPTGDPAGRSAFDGVDWQGGRRAA